MKAEQITIYGIYSTDGYNESNTGIYFPISAAADAYINEKLGGSGYYRTSAFAAIRVGDSLFLSGSAFSKDKTGKKSIIPVGSPVLVYKNYNYKDGWDKSTYYSHFQEFEETLLVKGQSASISRLYIFRDSEDNYFELKGPESVKLESYTHSVEIARIHALGKLTEEEKKLLGLD